MTIRVHGAPGNLPSIVHFLDEGVHTAVVDRVGVARTVHLDGEDHDVVQTAMMLFVKNLFYRKRWYESVKRGPVENVERTMTINQMNHPDRLDHPYPFAILIHDAAILK